MKSPESFLEQPIRSLQTMLRVLAEADSRLPTVIPDGIYGPATTNAVAAIQRQSELPATGVTDKKTWDAIVKRYESALIIIGKAEPIEIVIDPGQVFRSGDSSPYVYLLQSMLTQLSEDHTMISAPNHNGTMDDSTTMALASFQKLSGLPQTGEFDKITWKHLVRQFTLNAHHHTALDNNLHSN